MTTTLDALLDAAVLEGAVAAGRSAVLSARQFGASRAAGVRAGAAVTRQTGRGQANRWTAEDDAFLARWAGELGDEELAARLGRSVPAVRVRRIRAGLGGPTVHPDYVTAQGAARALGVDVHAVCAWIDLGLLPAAELAPLAGRKVWRLRRSALYAWALRPENWIYFIRSIRAGRVADARLARLIERRAETWGDAWWSTGEVAAYHGVISNDVERYIKAGRLPAVQWGNWYVLRSEATRPGLRFFKGKGAGVFERAGTAAGDAFLVLAVAAGLPAEHIARLMRRRTHGGVQSRYAAIVRRGLVPALIRAYDLPVRYRAADGAIWADWRAAGRFPAVARAWDKWGRGERLSGAERFALAGVLRAAAEWAGDEATADALRRGLPGRPALEAGARIYRRLARERCDHGQE